jgi:hypothetical protein
MAMAVGTLEVKMKPEALSDMAASTGISRMSLDKVFSGQLDAASQGEFLSIMDFAKGSGAYVAVERVTGTLEGKVGSFGLYHRGVMKRGAPVLEIDVVPGSGTGELAGIRGSMKIDIVEKQHHYEFEYHLSNEPD